MVVPPPRCGRMMTTMMEMTTGHRPSRRVVCKRVSNDARAMTNASDSRWVLQTMSQGFTRVGLLMQQGLRGASLEGWR